MDAKGEERLFSELGDIKKGNEAQTRLLTKLDKKYAVMNSEFGSCKTICTTSIGNNAVKIGDIESNLKNSKIAIWKRIDHHSKVIYAVGILISATVLVLGILSQFGVIG